MKTIVTVCDVESRRILGKTPWTTNASLPAHGDTFVFGGEEFFVDHRRWEEIIINVRGFAPDTPSAQAASTRLVGLNPELVAEPALNVTLVVRATGGKTNALSLSTEAVRGAAIDECIGLLEEWAEIIDTEETANICRKIMKEVAELKVTKRVEVPK